MGGRHLLGAVVAAMSVLTATACSGGGASAPTAATTPTNPCLGIAHDLVAATQHYVDGFGVESQPTLSTAATPVPTPHVPAMTQQQYADAVTYARSRIGASGCQIDAFHEAMQSGLQSVRSHGAIAAAILEQLKVTLTGQLPATAVTRNATPRDNLSALLATMPDGSTLTLGKGTYHLRDTLVLLRAVTIRGAGADVTVLTSGAADAVALVLTSAPVALRGMSLRRVGSAAGSVLMVAPAARVALDGVHVSGGRVDKQGAGGVGVLLTASGADVPGSSVTFRATRSSFTDNASAGVAAGGTHRIAITRSTFMRNQQCGVCYLAASAGTISTSSFRRDGVGVLVASTGRTAVRQSSFVADGIGIQVTGSAKPSVTGNTFTNLAKTSMLFTGQSAGTIDGNDCSGDPNGIAVARSAYPYVGTNKCRVTLGK